MKGFWNDADGLTVTDILALAFGAAAIFAYFRYGTIDANFADICIGAVLAAAGQKVGNVFVRSRGSGNSNGTI